MWNTEVILLFAAVFFVAFIIVRANHIKVFFRRLKYLFYSPDYYEARMVRDILIRKSVFFKSLSEKGKNHMIKKSIHFMMSKRFIPMEGIELTDEMIAEISGAAAQLTFGLKNSSFSHFHTIKIFPETFYSKLIDNHLKGGASVSGVLYFSWEDFQLGYADHDDRINLGLHEMAHALRLQLRSGSDFDEWFAGHSDHWIKVAMPEFKKMREGNPSFLRDYASTNMEEFFSVCVEHFFEVPHEFKANLPDIYNHMSYLLRLDPTNKNNDYRLDENLIKKIVHEKEIASRQATYEPPYIDQSWHWSFNLIIGGFFIALPIIIVTLPSVIIDLSSLLFIAGIILFLATKLKEYFKEWGITLYRHLVLFALAGVALPLIASLLVINRTLSENRVSYIFPITGYRIREMGPRKSEFTFLLNGGAFDSKPAVRKLINTGSDEYLSKARYMILTTSTGALGFTNIEKRHLVIDNDTVMVSNPNY